MNAWETIKARMTAGTTPGTFGEGRKLNEAARLFMALRPYLKDEEGETAAFNADEEVRKALMQRVLEKQFADEEVL